jgi:hypothetical protein
MTIWREFPWSAIDAYLRDFMWGEAPAFWELETESAAEGRGERLLFGNSEVSVRRRTDSLALEIQFPRRYRAMVSQPEGNLLAGIASAEDEGRVLMTSEEPFASGVVVELETDVPSGSDAERRLPAIGPGGRAVAFERADGLAADVVIRRRRRWLPGSWRSGADIAARLHCACQGIPPDFRTRAAFGYFELSKYERQRLLRPVFLFSFGQRQDEDGRWPGWMTTVVEPATVGPGISLDDGVGLWSE